MTSSTTQRASAWKSSSGGWLGTSRLRAALSIIESGHWLRSDRDTKRDWARGHGVGIELVVLDVPIDERWRRLAARNAAAAPTSVPLTLEVLQSYEGLFQLPDAEEQRLYDPSSSDPGPA